MVIVSFFGSPHRDGISGRLHEAFLAPLERSGVVVVRVHAYEALAHPCTACGGCAPVPACVHRDVMDELYDHIRGAAGITVSSPLYFTGLPGPLKNMIDRCQLLWEEARRGGRFPAKTGSLILTAGDEYPRMFIPASTVIRHFFNVVNCAYDESDAIFVPRVDGLTAPGPDLLANIAKKSEKYLKNLGSTGILPA